MSLFHDLLVESQWKGKMGEDVGSKAQRYMQYLGVSLKCSTQYSWKVRWMEEHGRLDPWGCRRVGQRLKQPAFTFRTVIAGPDFSIES